MRKFLIRRLLLWYAGVMDKKATRMLELPDELKAYTFKSPELTEQLIRSILSAQTVWHYEAQGEEERLMAKGAANILKIIKDNHIAALKIYKPESPDESLKDWVKYKKTHRVN